MSHVSISNSSYPYRGTLIRLDENGDGLLSREEIAADQRPGLLAASADKQSSDDHSGNGTGALGNLIAKLMQLPPDGNAALETTDLMQPGTGSDADTGTQTAMDLYRGTYGQYALDDMAA